MVVAGVISTVDTNPSHFEEYRSEFRDTALHLHTVHDIHVVLNVSHISSVTAHTIAIRTLATKTRLPHNYPCSAFAPARPHAQCQELWLQRLRPSHFHVRCQLSETIQSLTRYSCEQLLGQGGCWCFSSARAHAQCQSHRRRTKILLHWYVARPEDTDQASDSSQLERR